MIKAAKIFVRDTKPGIMIRVDVPELQSWETLALTYEETSDLMGKLAEAMVDYLDVLVAKKMSGVRTSSSASGGRRVAHTDPALNTANPPQLEKTCPVCKGKYRNLLKHKQLAHSIY